jgi:hypothetical protein
MFCFQAFSIRTFFDRVGQKSGAGERQAYTKVLQKYQITIPKKVREKLGGSILPEEAIEKVIELAISFS